MKKIFRYYNDRSCYSTKDIKVVADNKNDAINVIWDYLEKSPRWDRDYFNENEIITNTKEYILDKSEILSDESTSPSLDGHFD